MSDNISDDQKKRLLELSAEYKAAVSDLVLERLDETDRSIESTIAMLEALLHTAGHVALSIETTLPRYMAVCSQSLLDAQACMLQVSLEDALAGTDTLKKENLH